MTFMMWTRTIFEFIYALACSSRFVTFFYTENWENYTENAENIHVADKSLVTNKKNLA